MDISFYDTSQYRALCTCNVGIHPETGDELACLCVQEINSGKVFLQCISLARGNMHDVSAKKKTIILHKADYSHIGFSFELFKPILMVSCHSELLIVFGEAKVVAIGLLFNQCRDKSIIRGSFKILSNVIDLAHISNNENKGQSSFFLNSSSMVESIDTNYGGALSSVAIVTTTSPSTLLLVRASKSHDSKMIELLPYSLSLRHILDLMESKHTNKPEVGPLGKRRPLAQIFRADLLAYEAQFLFIALNNYDSNQGFVIRVPFRPESFFLDNSSEDDDSKGNLALGSKYELVSKSIEIPYDDDGNDGPSSLITALSIVKSSDSSMENEINQYCIAIGYRSGLVTCSHCTDSQCNSHVIVFSENDTIGVLIGVSNSINASCGVKRKVIDEDDYNGGINDGKEAEEGNGNAQFNSGLIVSVNPVVLGLVGHLTQTHAGIAITLFVAAPQAVFGLTGIFSDFNNRDQPRLSVMKPSGRAAYFSSPIGGYISSGLSQGSVHLLFEQPFANRVSLLVCELDEKCSSTTEGNLFVIDHQSIIVTSYKESKEDRDEVDYDADPEFTGAEPSQTYFTNRKRWNSCTSSMCQHSSSGEALQLPFVRVQACDASVTTINTEYSSENYGSFDRGYRYEEYYDDVNADYAGEENEEDYGRYNLDNEGSNGKEGCADFNSNRLAHLMGKRKVGVTVSPFYQAIINDYHRALAEYLCRDSQDRMRPFPYSFMFDADQQRHALLDHYYEEDAPLLLASESVEAQHQWAERQRWLRRRRRHFYMQRCIMEPLLDHLLMILRAKRVALFRGAAVGRGLFPTPALPGHTLDEAKLLTLIGNEVAKDSSTRGLMGEEVGNKAKKVASCEGDKLLSKVLEEWQRARVRRRQDITNASDDASGKPAIRGSGRAAASSLRKDGPNNVVYNLNALASKQKKVKSSGYNSAPWSVVNAEKLKEKKKQKIMQQQREKEAASRKKVTSCAKVGASIELSSAAVVSHHEAGPGSDPNELPKSYSSETEEENDDYPLYMRHYDPFTPPPRYPLVTLNSELFGDQYFYSNAVVSKGKSRCDIVDSGPRIFYYPTLHRRRGFARIRPHPDSNVTAQKSSSSMAPPPHAGAVTSLLFDPTGSILISAGMGAQGPASSSRNSGPATTIHLQRWPKKLGGGGAFETVDRRKDQPVNKNHYLFHYDRIATMMKNVDRTPEQKEHHLRYYKKHFSLSLQASISKDYWFGDQGSNVGNSMVLAYSSGRVHGIDVSLVNLSRNAWAPAIAAGGEDGRIAVWNPLFTIPKGGSVESAEAGQGANSNNIISNQPYIIDLLTRERGIPYGTPDDLGSPAGGTPLFAGALPRKGEAGESNKQRAKIVPRPVRAIKFCFNGKLLATGISMSNNAYQHFKRQHMLLSSMLFRHPNDCNGSSIKDSNPYSGTCIALFKCIIDNGSNKEPISEEGSSEFSEEEQFAKCHNSSSQYRDVFRGDNYRDYGSSGNDGHRVNHALSKRRRPWRYYFSYDSSSKCDRDRNRNWSRLSLAALVPIHGEASYSPVVALDTLSNGGAPHHLCYATGGTAQRGWGWVDVEAEKSMSYIRNAHATPLHTLMLSGSHGTFAQNDENSDSLYEYFYYSSPHRLYDEYHNDPENDHYKNDMGYDECVGAKNKRLRHFRRLWQDDNNAHRQNAPRHGARGPTAYYHQHHQHCLATAAFDGVVKIWDIRCARHCQGGCGSVTAAPSCAPFYSATDSTNSSHVLAITGHVNVSVKVGLAWSPCGRYIVIGSEDNSAIVHDLRGGTGGGGRDLFDAITTSGGLDLHDEDCDGQLSDTEGAVVEDYYHRYRSLQNSNYALGRPGHQNSYTHNIQHNNLPHHHCRTGAVSRLPLPAIPTALAYHPVSGILVAGCSSGEIRAFSY